MHLSAYKSQVDVQHCVYLKFSGVVILRLLPFSFSDASLEVLSGFAAPP